MSDASTSVEPGPKASGRRSFLERRAQPLPKRAQLILTIVTLVVLVIATWLLTH